MGCTVLRSAGLSNLAGPGYPMGLGLGSAGCRHQMVTGRLQQVREPAAVVLVGPADRSSALADPGLDQTVAELGPVVADRTGRTADQSHRVAVGTGSAVPEAAEAELELAAPEVAGTGFVADTAAVVAAASEPVVLVVPVAVHLVRGVRHTPDPAVGQQVPGNVQLE